MRFVIQRVSSASVTIDGKVRGEIGKGFVVLIGIGEDDTKEIADKLLHKLLNMRIFEDENGKTNLALKDVSGELLMISQFTLYANCKKGNRPSFTDAGRPEMAEPMYEYILEACRKALSRLDTNKLLFPLYSELLCTPVRFFWCSSLYTQVPLNTFSRHRYCNI